MTGQGDGRLRRWYRKYNAAYFNNELPDDTIVYWEPCTQDCAGATCPVYEVAAGKFEIKLDPAMMGFPSYWKIVLLHEMAHVKLWITNPKHQHGKVFRTEIERLFAAGAYKALF